MDIEAAIGVLDDFIGRTNADRRARVPGGLNRVSQDDTDRAVVERLALVQNIGSECFSQGLYWQRLPSSRDPWSGARESAYRVRGWLADSEEASRILSPAGPRLAANALHEWVWNAAATLWASGHYRAAVHAAATLVDQNLQAKAGRSDSGASLVGNAFSDEPPRAGQVRLWMPGHAERGEDWQSQQDGAKLLGMGCMKLIRNSAAHSVDELPEQEALERLAALSVFARAVELSDVVTA